LTSRQLRGDDTLTEPQKPDRSNRIVLIIMGVLALITIGGAIYATMGEWNAGNTGSSETTSAPAEEEPLPSAGY
jgi:hypothetical protein